MTVKYQILTIFLITIMTYLFLNYDDIIGTYPIKTITLKGQFIHIDEDKLHNSFQSFIGRDLVDIDIIDIKNNVKKNDWVKNALVERQFPNTLFIEIFEYVPIIFWNGHSYIDDEGIKFKVKNNILTDIPQINSNTQDYKKMYNLYLDLSKMLEKIDLKIYSISHDKDMLNITTNKYDFLVRYSRYYIKIDEFIHVYEQFRNQYKKNIKTIDLRYPTGFAVH